METINELSPCQRLSLEDCNKAKQNLRTPDKLSIAGKCPKDCSICLYKERYQRNDCQWIPQPSDKQYPHWLNR
jgi:hypothetical protein